MFEHDRTGTLKGYFDRMHPTVQEFIKIMELPSAQMDPMNLDLVWRGWIKQETMEEIFGDLYDHEARPNGVPSWINKVDKSEYHLCKYGTWMATAMMDTRYADVMVRDGAIEFLKELINSKRGDHGWLQVIEAILLIVEDEGVMRLRVKVRGWRKYTDGKQVH